MNVTNFLGFKKITKCIHFFILQQSARLIPEKTPEKSTSSSKPSTITVGKSEVTSTLASLFEPQHPWSREGEINMGGFMGGGFLGIRGGMPRLPSFKVGLLAFND